MTGHTGVQINQIGWITKGQTMPDGNDDTTTTPTTTTVNGVTTTHTAHGTMNGVQAGTVSGPIRIGNGELWVGGERVR